jgi:RecA-family ATPase
LLPEGVLMLGGKPKQGKSWLVLSLALEVAAGDMVFGKYQATQGEVLYLALEDTEQRLQARTRRLLTSMTSVPSGISFATEWPRLDQGGLTQLETYIKAHPQLRLVVVDTWAKVSPRTKGEARSQYEHDYSALTSLKNVADTYHITILLVHHLRKTGAEDPLDEIAGSTGIAGAVDGVLLLKRAHGENQATLLITGRDIEEQCLSLTFDSSTTVWQLDNAAEL